MLYAVWCLKSYADIILADMISNADAILTDMIISAFE